jgi:hypothetical protein
MKILSKGPASHTVGKIDRLLSCTQAAGMDVDYKKLDCSANCVLLLKKMLHGSRKRDQVVHM